VNFIWEESPYYMSDKITRFLLIIPTIGYLFLFKHKNGTYSAEFNDDAIKYDEVYFRESFTDDTAKVRAIWWLWQTFANKKGFMEKFLTEYMEYVKFQGNQNNELHKDA